MPGDEIVGYISLGKGVTIHRGDCPNVRALMRNPERFTPVEWDGGPRRASASRSRSTPGTGRACSRTSRGRSPSTARTSSATAASVEDQLAKNWYVVEVGDIKALRSLLSTLRNIDGVFDAYRVTPS